MVDMSVFATDVELKLRSLRLFRSELKWRYSYGVESVREGMDFAAGSVKERVDFAAGPERETVNFVAGCVRG